MKKGGGMFRNYWLIAIRNFKRYKVHAIVNVSGLAIGLAACILILLFVQFELSYDRFHAYADRIYRVAVEQSAGDQTIVWPQAPVALATELQERFPEVLRVTKVFPRGRTLVQYGENRFYEQNGYLADASFFDVFSFPVAQGNPKAAWSDLNSIVITQAFARKYFGDEDPMGKTIVFPRISRSMIVRGVLEDVPSNSHFKPDFLIPFKNFRMVGDDPHLHTPAYIYLLLTSADAADGIETRLAQESETVTRRKERQRVYRPFLQALTDIHLFSHLDQELEPNRDVGDLYLFSGIALLILVIAGMNYMNLATARSAGRAREISVRKVVGARRLQLVSQLLSESVLVTALAFALSIALVEVVLPVFNAYANTGLHLSYGDGRFWLCVIALAVGVGVLSGSYPAFVLSRFPPVEVLKGASKTHPSGAWFRRALVVFQFAASIGLMIVTGIVFNQLAFVKDKALGFDKAQVVVVEAKGIRGAYRAFARGNFGRYDAFKHDLLSNPNVLNIGASSSIFGGYCRTRAYTTEGKTDEVYDWETLFVDYDFIKTMGIEVREGRNFSRDFSTDLRDAVILNETAVRELGWDNAVGKRIERTSFPKCRSRVIGVVKDFHTQSLHHAIQPLVIGLFPGEADHIGFFLVKIRTENVPETLAFLRARWQAWAPDYPFHYSFLDEDYDALYRSETQLLRIFTAFAGLAIFIACLGLFGLASFMAESRTKEIGIRKVLGASAANICTLLSMDFVKLVAIANLISWPVVFWVMRLWLRNFAYRIDPGIGVFILCGLLALGIALVTVSYQAIRAACANPVDALRYE